MTNTSLSIHDAKAIRFHTARHTAQYEGGWLSVVVGTGKNEFGSPDLVEFTIHTWDNAVFDHFRDIERLANGPTGSLRAKPPEEGAT